ncbi:hypothetical protein EV363DRAFT_1200607 [Boletus edulis]|uniref:Uncharacterized protein n=1 Tax=Boletus edulis BED1 TaxID=1328754 RepID=A0AAD4BAB2_BOLED|nr:hypothetical protein EV363DRAFT_1200607 [Boletus edulis]KAF8414638.1 hypothetical protein L210DRAFT_880241 [Boletus edulis BED1]
MRTESCLTGENLLGDEFREVPFLDLPALVIELPNKQSTQRSPSVFRSASREDPVARARDEFLSGYQKQSPSSGGIPSTFRSRQHGNTFIPCGRACNDNCSDEETIPTTLLHPILGQFADDCRELELSAEDHLLAGDLEIAMSKFYKDEAARVEGVSMVLIKHKIHLNVSSKIPNSRYVMDADMSVDKYRYVIAEFKNEAGGTQAEPFLEAIAYYVESTRELAPKIPRSPLPCLLLAIYGPHIVFAGATWNRRPVVQVLSMPVAFHIHHTDDRLQLTVARHMAAFRRASEALRTYYEQIGDIPIPLSTCPPAAKALFPYPTSYGTLTGNAVKTFQYKTQVVEKKLVFFATQDDDGSCICVKFTQTYSVEAHQHLASRKCAPAMRGMKNLPGGWIMIVVDALLEFETLYDRKEPLPSTLFVKMEKTLRDFHEHRFVHGDIRDVNIMVHKESIDEFRFIDLDWSGVSGLARYPARINTLTIKRPPNVISRGIIAPEDDLFMLDGIRKLKCRD